MHIQSSSFISRFIEPVSYSILKEKISFVITSIALGTLLIGVGYLVYNHFFKNRKVTLLGNSERSIKQEPANRVANLVLTALSPLDLIHYKEKLTEASNLLESASESLAGDYAETMKMDIQKAGNKIIYKALRDIEDNSADKTRCLAILTSALEELEKVRFNCEKNLQHNTKLQKQWLWHQKLKEIIKNAKINPIEKSTREFLEELQRHYQLINTCFAKETIFHFLAKEGGPLEFVEIFTNCRVNFNIQDRYGYNPCMIACSNRNYGMALEIIEKGQTKNHNLDIATEQLSNTMLIILAGLGYKKDKIEQENLRLKLVEKLIDLGASVTKSNLKGLTPLHMSCLRRDPKMTEILLRVNPDLDCKTRAGFKPIDLLNLNYEEASNLINELLEFPSELDQSEFNSNLPPMQILLGIA